MANADRAPWAAISITVAALCLAATAPVARAETPAPSDEPATTVEGLSAAQLLQLADRLEGDDEQAARRIYQALQADPDLGVRNEARFRLGQLQARRGEIAEAVSLYRAILKEQPDAQRVRIELAGLLAQAGELGAAQKELKQARAGGLPPEIARGVDQFAAALRSARPYRASVELALAPSNNVNRATRASTLDTVIAPFELSDDARAQSGIGVRVGGQAFVRKAVAKETELTFRLSGQGNFYKAADFNDLVGAAQLGVETKVGKTQVRPLLGRSYRWYGGELYATTDTGAVTLTRPLGERAQVITQLGYGQADYRLNNLQDGAIYTGGVTYERQLSPKSGAGFGLSFERQDARDPGYATTSGEAQLLLWRQLRGASLFADLRVSKLEADERLTLFPERREEWRFSPTLGATLGRFKVHGFAPVVRISYEQNNSTVGIYDYSRVAADLGFTRAF